MKTLLDFFPVVAFVAAYWITKDFYFAIAIIMGAVVIQISVTWLVTRTVHRLMLISAGLVIVLGAISLLLQNDLVFKWKPTVLYWLFAVMFLGSRFIGERPLVQRILESVSEEPLLLSRSHWVQLNLMWIVFFLIAGTANIVVAYNFEEAVWVNFKLFGLFGITLVFMVLQAIWITQRTADKSIGSDQGQ